MPEKKNLMVLKEFDVIEDVSLVDAAANKEKFLAMKAARKEASKIVNEEADKQMDVEPAEAAGMLRKMYGMLRAMFGGGGEAKPEEKKKEAVMESDKGNDKEKAPAPELAVAEKFAGLEATVADLSSKLKARDDELAGLKAQVEERERTMRRAEAERKVEGWIKGGHLLPAQRDFALSLALGESVSVKAADGSELQVDAATALDKLVECNKGLSFGEKASVSEHADLGKYGGKTPAEYAKTNMIKTGKLLAEG